MEKQKFDSNKNYTWSPDTEVVLTGKQYGFLRTFVNMVVNSPEAQRLMMGMECAGILQGILEKGVEDEWVTELKEENNTVEFKPKENIDGLK